MVPTKSTGLTTLGACGTVAAVRSQRALPRCRVRRNRRLAVSRCWRSCASSRSSPTPLRRPGRAHQAHQILAARIGPAVVGPDPRRRGACGRRVNVPGQQYHVTGAPMDGSSIDNHNRKVYEESVKVIKKAWTAEAWDYDGDYYKVPYPYQDGIRRWPGADRKICVVPKPYELPHPPMFEPFSVSETTIRYTAHRSVDPRCESSRLPAPVPRLPRCGGDGRPHARPWRERRRVPRRPLRQHGGGDGRVAARHQLRSLPELLRGIRLLGGVSHGRGCREVSAGSVYVASAGRVDRRPHAPSQVRARGNAGPDQARVRVAPHDRWWWQSRVVWLVLRAPLSGL